MSTLNHNVVPATVEDRSPLHQLMVQVKEHLQAGRSFTNPTLTAAAQRCFGGGRGGGHYTAKDAYDAMEGGFNLWLLDGKGAELVGLPFDSALAELQQMMGQLATQTDRTQEMVELQQFSTPPPMAFLAARLLAPQPEEEIMEPSAGTGNLAVWAKVMGAKVTVNEIADRRRGVLRILGFDPHGVDAELLDDLLPDDVTPTAILMNPPFSATGGRVTRHDPMYGAKHIEQALRRLVPGGRMVAISSPAMAMGAAKFNDWWQGIASRYNVRANYTISGAEYRKFGTTVDTQMIVIDKDGRTPGDSWVGQLENIKWGRGETVEAAWEELKSLAVREPRGDEERETEEPENVFVPYLVKGLTGGGPHPAEIVESASMAAVALPPPTYRPRLPLSVVTEGKLSMIQLESVVYAGQRHEQRLADGARGGMFIGHGTGLGKGRILAAIIVDNWHAGRRRAIWLSVNNDLLPATQRDLTDIGCDNIPLARINDYQADGDITLSEGVLFCSYSSLISESKKKRKRLDQIMEWLGREGVVIFDECVPGDTKIATPTGEREIKDLKVGDLVLGFNHKTGQVEATEVKHCFQRKTKAPLQQVLKTSMTGNHPVWTADRGYITADKLSALDRLGVLSKGELTYEGKFYLRVVPATIPAQTHAHGQEAAVLRQVSFCQMANESARLCPVIDNRSQSSDLPGKIIGDPRSPRSTRKAFPVFAFRSKPVSLCGQSPERACQASGQELRTSERWQWYGDDQAAENASGASGLAMGVPCTRKAQTGRFSDQLQIRFSGTQLKDWYRDRWGVPYDKGYSCQRCQKGRISPGAGVAGVEILERRNIVEFGGGDGEDTISHDVYNIETGTGNYFANDLLVHNCHKSKNAIGSGRGDGTQTGQAVIDLQGNNPEYRIVYSSATGATDVRNMAYMTRLGLWGPGTAFPGGFNEFLNQIEEGGVGAMEMVSRDLKSLGMYLSGSISFGLDEASGKAVEYRTVIHKLTPEQREMYDLAARAWQHVLKNIDKALNVTGAGSRQKANARTKFWGDHQRFFSQVLTAFRVPTLIKEIERCLAEDKSIVVSLVSTGEARTREQVGQAVAKGEGLEDLDFTPREVIIGMIERGFPTTMYQNVQDPVTGRVYAEAVTDKHGNPVQSKEALRMKQDLLDGLTSLRLPDNPLDQVINYFGPEAVAELTGRSRRLIRDRATGRVTYTKRVPEGIAMRNANIHEMNEFQAGRKRIAIISDAASMGISLHASRDCQNQQRRVHVTLQTGWSADKQMQTFGRTHRSNQVVPPEYVLLGTDQLGEVRFLSTIAKRLGSLGALTKGERMAADSGDLAKFNFETAEGRSALQYFFRSIVKDNETVPDIDDPKQALRDMGLLVTDSNYVEVVRKEDESNIPRFMNRCLALECDRQNAIFRYFATIFERAVFAAKTMGTFDAGVTDIRAEAIRFGAAPRVIAKDEVTGAATTYFRLDVDKKLKTCTFEDAEKERIGTKGCYLRHLRNGFVVMAAPSGRRTDEDGYVHQRFALSRPKGSRVEWKDDVEIDKKFVPMQPEDAKVLWQAEYNELPKVQTTQMHIIGGAILPLWRRLKSEQESKLKIVRVTTDDGTRIVGASIDPSRVGPVLRAVGVSRDLKSPQEILNAILKEGDRLQLVNGMYLYKRLIHNEPYVTLGGNLRYQDYGILGGLGMYMEYVPKYGSIYYLPTNELEWPAILTALLKQYPPLRSREEVEADLTGAQDSPAMFMPVAPVDIHDLIIPVPEAQAEPEPSIEVCAPFQVNAAEEVPLAAQQPVETASRRRRSAKRVVPTVTRPEAHVATGEPPVIIIETFEFDKRGQGLLF